MTDERRPSLREALRDRIVTTADTESVPPALRVATAYAWRLLVIAGAIAVLVWVVIQLKLLVVPMLIAMLLTALLAPAMHLMLRHRFPRWLAVVIAMLGTLAIVGGLLWVAIWQIVQQFPEVQRRAVAGIEDFRDYLLHGPFHIDPGLISPEQLNAYLQQGWQIVQDQWQTIFHGALAVGTTVGHVAAGVLLVFFVLICLLADGAGIWRWVLKLVPRKGREAADEAARAGWKTVTNYGRTQLMVAAIDAVGIGLGAFLLGVPLAVPIGVLVFLGAFVPFVGAVVTGSLAVVVALVYNGPWIAVAMLAVILLVQQVEGHLLQPILMGSAVKVHPLAVVLVVAGGAMIAGIPGALFAVPLAAFVNVFALTLSARSTSAGVIRQEDLIWRTVPRERRAR